MVVVHVVGTALTELLPEHDAMLDELAYDVTSRALRAAGLTKPDLGLSVLASLDVYDGRSISAGLTTPAVGGFASDAYRIEGDVSQAIVAAYHAIAAGDVEVAVAVGIHHPESRPDRWDAGLRTQLSNLTFDPAFDRPVGMTGDVALAMQAGASDRAGLAAIAAAEINRGAGRPRAVRRSEVSVADVLRAARVADPLTELMLPAHCTGAGAVVLASSARAARCRGSRARITGVGTSAEGYTWSGGWLRDPGGATRRAAGRAYAAAGVTGSGVRAAEVSALTPASLGPLVDALGLDPAVVNASGGVRSAYPGLLNGLLRLEETMEALETAGGGTGVAHSVDSISGPVSQDVAVLVVEVP